MSRPIVGKANKNPGRCAGLQLSVLPVTHQHDTTSTENSTGELETEFEEMKKKGGYEQHVRKENVLEEPGFVTGR